MNLHDRCLRAAALISSGELTLSSAHTAALSCAALDLPMSDTERKLVSEALTIADAYVSPIFLRAVSGASSAYVRLKSGAQVVCRKTGQPICTVVQDQDGLAVTLTKAGVDMRFPDYDTANRFIIENL